MAKHLDSRYDAFCMYKLVDSIANNNWNIQDEAINNLTNDNFTEKLATLKSIDFSKVDIITISYGTNDFIASKNLEEFKQALKHSIETISDSYPDIKIVLCTPIYRFWMDENGLFLDDSNTHVNDLEQKLTDFVQWIKDVANEYNLYVIDNYDNSGINSKNRTEAFPSNDGSHPNEIGRKMIAEHMAKKLYEKYRFD